MPAYAKDANVLRLGIDPTYPPMDVKMPDGTVTGFDVDLANEICRRIAMHCQWVEMEFSGMIPALQARKIDAIISSMAITEKRMQQIAFSTKLFQFKSRLIAKTGAPVTVSVEGLRGKRIGVQSGTQFEAYAQKNWQSGGVEVVAYQSQEGVFQDLEAGRLDAALLGSVEADNGFLKTPRGKGFGFVGGPLEMGDHGTGIGLRKDDVALKASIDSAIAGMRADGTYQKIARKYFDFDVYGN
ncbi:transporter substrate-binding domain-containing protein [Caballeronia sp. 15715]|uniref:transporter substrate-binding domain-containing protein n=1 Tax=unclassified Caballeronia TaxID=2646786 RepID=UPI0039E2AA23